VLNKDGGSSVGIQTVINYITAKQETTNMRPLILQRTLGHFSRLEPEVNEQGS
jgi:hypothetical protein